MKAKAFNELTLLDVYPDLPKLIRCDHCGSDKVELGLNAGFTIQHAGVVTLYGYDCHDCKGKSLFPVKMWMYE